MVVKKSAGMNPQGGGNLVYGLCRGKPLPGLHVPDVGNLPQALLSPIRTLLDSKRFLRSLNGPTINGSRTSVESVSVYVAEEGLQIHIQYLAATMENNPLQVYHSSTFNYILPSSSIR